MKQSRKLLQDLGLSLVLEGFCGCLIGLKNFVLSTFARNVPLRIKTSGGLFSFGGGPFLFGGRDYTYPCSLHQAILPFISSRTHISTHLHLLKPSY